MTDIAGLTARLAEWIKARGIETFYGPEGTARRVVAENHPANVERWLNEDSPSLAGRCRDFRDEEDLTDQELAREKRLHGHHGRGPRRNMAGRGAAA